MTINQCDPPPEAAFHGRTVITVALLAHATEEAVLAEERLNHTRHLPGGGKNRRNIGVDGGDAGQRVNWLAERFACCLAVVLRPEERTGFVLLPRRWVAERTFGWLQHSRRLSKRYERLTRTDERWIYPAMTRLRLERLA